MDFREEVVISCILYKKQSKNLILEVAQCPRLQNERKKKKKKKRNGLCCCCCCSTWLGRVMVGLGFCCPSQSQTEPRVSLPQSDNFISVVRKGIHIKWLQLEHVIVSQCSLSSICRFSIQPFYCHLH
ncbi:Uncharacterized protein TCM_034597 [Theobroma cacao]|uniref:Uncharacterized protein n=1 Tax=Theobroma cacao TaxID=3641 RepID=A0A061FE25_THECC|nr:Uncharacterized protein TCM_034597 [Theobroma cacao]